VASSVVAAAVALCHSLFAPASQRSIRQELEAVGAGYQTQNCLQLLFSTEFQSPTWNKLLHILGELRS
jgi:hypothetical protein